jgi:hypothetical protein
MVAQVIGKIPAELCGCRDSRERALGAVEGRLLYTIIFDMITFLFLLRF